jgi:hypothetical protein
MIVGHDVLAGAVQLSLRPYWHVITHKCLDASCGMLLHEVDDGQCDLGRLEERLGFLIVERVHVRCQQTSDRENDEDKSQFVRVRVLCPAGGGHLLGIERGSVGIELCTRHDIIAIGAPQYRKNGAERSDSLEGVQIPVKLL